MRAQERILRDLSAGEWVCATQWLSSYLYVYSQRISEINAKEPGRIITRPCRQHDHKVYEYRDTTVVPRQMTWVAA